MKYFDGILFTFYNGTTHLKRKQAFKVNRLITVCKHAHVHENISKIVGTTEMITVLRKYKSFIIFQLLDYQNFANLRSPWRCSTGQYRRVCASSPVAPQMGQV